MYDDYIACLAAQKPGAGPIDFKTPYVTVRGPGAHQMAETMRAMMIHAYSVQGSAAFVCTKTAAAIHEASHLIVYHLDGWVPTHGTIWPIMEFGQPQWIGRSNYSAPSCHSDATTCPQADLRIVRSQFAGWLGELLFDADFKYGSSLDEVVTGTGLIRQAAFKLECDPTELWLKTLANVGSMLKTHEPIVRAIAQHLIDKGVIRARKIQYFLHTGGER